MPKMPLMCILSCVCDRACVYACVCVVCAYECAYVCNCALACVDLCECVFCATLHLCMYYSFLNEKKLGVLIQRKLTVFFRVLRSSLINRTIFPTGMGTGGQVEFR